MDISQLIATNPQLVAALGCAQPRTSSAPPPPPCAAAAAGDIAALEKLCTGDSDFRVTDAEGWTPLISACQAGHEAAATWLLKHGPSDLVNAKCTMKDAPAIHYAIGNNYPAIVTLLLAHGADPNATDRRSWTPAHLAAQANRTDILRELVAAGADLTATTNDGLTCAYVAAARDAADALALLLELRAPAGPCREMPLIVVAAQRGAVAAVQTLLANGVDPDERETRNGTTALMGAVTENAGELVDVLVSAGANPELTDNDGWTLYHFAAASGAPDLFETVRTHCPNVSVGATAKNNVTACHLAVSRRNVAAYWWLVEHGAPVDPADANGVTPFLISMQVGDAELADKLSQRQDVNLLARSTKSNLSALHLASSRNYGPVLRRILAVAPAGAAEEVCDDEGRTPAILAAVNGADQSLEALADADVSLDTPEPAKGFTPLMFAVIKHRAPAVRVILRHNVDINRRNNAGQTALYLAADSAAGECAEQLLAAGADHTITCGEENAAAAHAAAAKLAGRVIEALAAAGADMNVVDTDNWTPLIWCIHQTAQTTGDAEPAVLAVARTLIDHGADVTVRCARTGRTALHFATRQNFATVVALLLEHGADSEARDAEGNTALIQAAFWNADNAAAVLIEHGANIEAKSDAGVSVLQTSVFREAPAVCRRLTRLFSIDVEHLPTHRHLRMPESDPEVAKITGEKLLPYMAAMFAKTDSEAEEQAAKPAQPAMPNCNVS